MTPFLLLCTALTLPPDFSKSYFTGLERPAATRVDIDRAGGPVILIVVDAMRPDHLTPYGYRRDTTPNLAALADDGLVLTNYFVNGNWTRPSTASLVTGLFPAEHAVEREHDRLAKQFVTLAELLGGAGVPTGAVVGNGNAGSAFGLERGFKFWADTVHHWRGLPTADQVTELALPFVREHRDEPFFLWLFMVDPHDPYHAPAPYEDMFAPDPSVPIVRSPHWELGRYTPAQIERMVATYDGALRYTDAAIGRLLDELRRLGLYEKATIIVTSDHGEAFGEHGVYLHAHHLYDEIVRAPFIVRAPEMSVRGAYSHYLFQTVDVFSTIVRAFGGVLPQHLPGVDIFAHLRNPRLNNPGRIVISEFHNFGISRRMIRTYGRKVIHADPADEEQFRATVGQRRLLPSVSFTEERVQMYNVARDPFERTDLYDGERGAPGPGWQRLLDLARKRRELRPSKGVMHVVENLDPETYRDLKALGYIQ